MDGDVSGYSGQGCQFVYIFRVKLNTSICIWPFKIFKLAPLTQVDDMSKFRVWDYPIREQYKNVLKNIKKTGVVQSVAEGFAMLESTEAGSFAFIHDEAQVRIII